MALRPGVETTRWACTLALATILIWMAGCADMQAVNTPPLQAVTRGLSEPEKQPVVVGHVLLIRDEEPQQTGRRLFDPITPLSIFIAREGASEAQIYSTDTDGNFSWALAPGRYTLVGWQYTWANLASRRVVTAEVNAGFQVDDQGVTTCIGTMELRLSGNRISTRFVDDRSGACLLKNTSGVSDVFRVSIPRSTASVGEFAELLDVCDPGWSLACDRSVQGLAPIVPAVSSGINNTRFTMLDSTSPSLKWQRARGPNTTYDVAIWEAVSYSFPLAGDAYLAGRRVVYRQGLLEPSFEVDTPLKPKTKYMWSVRLRRGQQVSTWSKAGHFTFLVFASSAGVGEWFKFETP